jgi:putative transposase
MRTHNRSSRKPHGRKSIRLKRFDYSQPGDYFITICTHQQRCIFGEIVDMRFRPRELGRVVQRCWQEIPEHFKTVWCNVIQIMPNHLHGIITITEQPVGVEYIQPLQGRQRVASYQHVIPGSLGSIVRSFKAAVTREVKGISSNRRHRLWQRNYYDHIIRSDISYFYIERYITLNPVFWHLDAENPGVSDNRENLEAMRNHLLRELGFNPAVVEYLMENEIEYRIWRRRNTSKQGELTSPAEEDN